MEVKKKYSNSLKTTPGPVNRISMYHPTLSSNPDMKGNEPCKHPHLITDRGSLAMNNRSFTLYATCMSPTLPARSDQKSYTGQRHRANPNNIRSGVSHGCVLASMLFGTVFARRLKQTFSAAMPTRSTSRLFNLSQRKHHRPPLMTVSFDGVHIPQINHHQQALPGQIDQREDW